MGKIITYLDNRDTLKELYGKCVFNYLFRVVARYDRSDPIFFDVHKTEDGKYYKIEVRELRHGVPVICMECLIEHGAINGDGAYVFVGDYIIHGFDFEFVETSKTLSVRFWLNYTDMIALDIPTNLSLLECIACG